MSAESGQERTEKATPRKLKKAREEGGLGRSQDLSAWLGVGAAALVLPLVVSNASRAAQEQLARLRDAIANPEPSAVTRALTEGLGSALWTLAPLFAAVAIAVVAGSATQAGGIRFTPQRLKPSFKNFNLAKGIKQRFGTQAWWQGAKAALKAGALAAVLYLAVQGITPLIHAAGALSVSQLLAAAAGGTQTLLRTAVVAGLLLAALDVAVVVRRNRKHTRMTRKELKDEQKNTEGDPLVKSAVRARQLAISRNRMMAEIAKADVVVVNPTHVAVALRYEPGKGAPRVVAKGTGHIAAKIRQRATEHRVPLVEDVPLARALHELCELGQEIPEHLYTAVARILAFVMALRRRGSAAGLHRAPQAVPA